MKAHTSRTIKPSFPAYGNQATDGSLSVLVFCIVFFAGLVLSSFLVGG